VIVSRRGALPEIVTDHVDGLHVEPSEPDALVAAIDRLVSEPALAARLGNAGRARIAGTFGIEGHLQRLEALYAELVAARH
jgi:glycosyltransferase involved in cell wall biosynthesis